MSALMTNAEEIGRQLETIQRALEAGINWFDTAATYGAGQSEMSLGLALHQLEAASAVHVATKVRLAPDQLDDIKSAVKSSLAGSLRRLRLPRVTLLQLHNSITTQRGDQATSITPHDVLGHEGVLAAFRELQTDGLIGHFGLTALGEENSLREVIQNGPWTSIQVSTHLLEPRTTGEDLIAFCARCGVAVLAIRVLAGGALAGQSPSAHTLKTPFFPLAIYEQNLRRAAALSSALPPGLSLKELAIRHVLSDQDIATAIIGFANADQVDEAVRFAAAGPLDGVLVTELLASVAPKSGYSARC